MRIATLGQPLPRGVYVAPWMGDAGEIVLLALTARQRLAAPPYTIPTGADRVAASDAMWEALERADPDVRTRLRAV
jgi:hypothetical protein